MNPLFIPPLGGYKPIAIALAIAFCIVYPIYRRVKTGRWLA